MKNTLSTISFILLAAGAAAQSVSFADDALDRGYTDRPYLRYEAQEGQCNAHDTEFIKVEGYDQTNLATEASFLQAAQLMGSGAYVEWVLDRDADAVCIRFSLPDSPDGTGTRQRVAIKSGERVLATVELNSYWAWGYTPTASVSEKYPDNMPTADKFARMRFDEANVLLSEAVPAGATLRLERLSDSPDPLTIDFIEAETAGPALPAPAGAVTYTGEGSLQAFINSNPGRIIFIPEGRYEISNTITINADGTRLMGAGMWRTELYFTAAPDNPRTYARRGVKCNANRCGLSDLSLNTVNNIRYYNNNSSNQNGKGLMGSWGQGSEIKNVRIEHFECGAWIADYDGPASDGLRVTHCRMRNNYADGINLCSGTHGAVVSHCSFRNNGDDDMASWSTGNWTHDNLFDHNTAENNWRASSLGFFGGRNNRATNLAIYDGMENGARVNADFPGTGFGDTGEIVIENVSVRRCGVCRGRCGILGDFWGNAQAALSIGGGNNYDLRNVRLQNIDIHDCRFEGVRIQSSGGRRVLGLVMRDIRVHSQQDGPAFSFPAGLRGNGSGHDLQAEDCGDPFMTDIPSTFDFPITSGIAEPAAGRTGIEYRAENGTITLFSPTPVTVYDIAGTVMATLSQGATAALPAPAFYFLVAGEDLPLKILLR